MLKPIDSKELLEVVKRLYEHSSKATPFNSDKLSINDINGTTFIPFKEIMACESNDNYCIIHLQNNETRTVSKTLKFIEAAIGNPQFLRVHQSYLVNTQYIRKYLKRDGGTIELSNGKLIPVSKSYKDQVQSYLNF